MLTYTADNQATVEEEFGCHTFVCIQAVAHGKFGYNQCVAQFAQNNAYYTRGDIEASAQQNLGDGQQLV